MIERIIVAASCFITTLILLISIGPGKQAPVPPQIYYPPFPIQQIPFEPPPPITPKISNEMPGYQDYGSLIEQLKEWNQEAQELTEVDTYGKSSRGKDIYFIRLHNKRLNNNCPKVLITASLHGNEPLSTSTVMGYIGTMLSYYGRDENITKLLDEREIVFVPVVSPDSYPNSRHVDGVDPNRNFPTSQNPNKRCVAPVQALIDFFLEEKFNAAISGHTFGRVFLIPWGDRSSSCPNDAEYQRIVGKMASMCKYRHQYAHQMYSRPIFGTEVDWYYRNGAFSCVMEFGTHQRKPSMEDTKSEFLRTFDGVLYFIEEAPLIDIQPNFMVLRAAA